MTEYRRFINRELSWLRFNFRVLEEGRGKKNPLLERLRFLAIAASNLDEFFEIRVSALEQQLAAQNTSPDNSGLTPEKALDRIYRGVSYLIKRLYAIWNQDILPNLAKENISILTYRELSDDQKEYVNGLYHEEFHPVLTPIKIDPAHPFPWIINKTLCIAAVFQPPPQDKQEGAGRENKNAKKDESENSNEIEIGVVTVPRILPRIIKLPTKGGRLAFILISEVIQENLDELFKGYHIRSKASFRITRNSNLYFNEEEALGLLEAIKVELHNRKKGDAVRLEIKRDAPSGLVKQLCSIFNLKKKQVHFVDGPVNFNRLMSLYEMVGRVDLKYKSFSPRNPDWLHEDENVLQKIKEKDILLHHPYDSFQPVIHFLQKASRDKDTLAIKMTLYRTATDSPLMHALIEAAQSGKEVTVVVELKARFDEASNVAWAKYLLDNGVHVVYGLLGLKTHCKLILLIRKESNKIVKYAHIGTGNYNEETASFYTDLSLFTCRPEIMADIVEVFNFLTSQSKEPQFKKLLVAPYFMLDKFLKMIEKETKAAKDGKEALIIFKVNGLQDTQIIEALYRASQAGVKIYGIVRGVCCLRAGQKGYSKNIQIRSIVGRFLEHARIFYFKNSNPQLYIGSADWMPRNLRRRIEVATPIINEDVSKRILHEILEFQLQDDSDARILNQKGKSAKERSTSVSATRTERSRGERVKSFSSQEAFMELAATQKNPLPKNRKRLII